MLGWFAWAALAAPPESMLSGGVSYSTNQGVLSFGRSIAIEGTFGLRWPSAVEGRGSVRVLVVRDAGVPWSRGFELATSVLAAPAFGAWYPTAGVELGGSGSTLSEPRPPPQEGAPIVYLAGLAEPLRFRIRRHADLSLAGVAVGAYLTRWSRIARVEYRLLRLGVVW